MDTIAKYLSSDLSFFQITWARYFFTVFFALPFMFFFFRKNLTWTTQPKLQILRGLTLFIANVLFFYSISIISMAKALTLAFVAPLITTALSPIILGEKELAENKIIVKDMSTGNQNEVPISEINQFFNKTS